MIGSTLQRPFTDYIAGNINLQFISPPTTGSNNITVTYRAGALNSLDLTASVFNAGTVAAPSVVSLAANNTGIYWANASSMSVTVSGTNRATFSASPNATTTSTGALQVNGGIGINGNAIIGGNVVIGDSTESTSVSTGSFKTAGGAGIVGNLNVGGDITCVGDFTVNGTFTTTGTDSLAVTDPFIFLAENNPGDTYDSGVVSQYFDGANTRYTGYFRDITDAKYKLFTNLLTQPTTTVDTTDPSFQYTDLILANLSASGNVTGTYFIGNGAALTGISTTTSNIFNANTSVAIAAVNANVNMVVNSTQIANVWSGGISVVGAVAASTTLSATGNVTGGNLITAGLITATGNITSAANVAGGNVLTGGIVSSAGNVTGGNISTAGLITVTGNVTGGNISTAGLITVSGNITGGNISTAGAISADSVSATGNTTSGNILTGGIVSATGNITGSYFLGNGSQLTGIDATSIQNGTSNVRVVSSGGNVAIGIGGTSNVAVFSTLGANIAGWAGITGNLGVGGNVEFTGTTQNINIGTSQTTGNATVGGATQTGTILIGQSTYPQTINIGHGVTGSGNTKTIQIGENGAAGSTTIIDIGPATATTAAGTVTFQTATVVSISNTSGTALSVAGNVTGGNVRSSGVISATTTVFGAGLSIGVGGAQVTGNVTGGNLITAAAVSAASVSASANVTGGNIITNGAISAGGLVSATGNITGGNINTAGLITATGNITSTANVAGGNILTANLVQGATLSATGNVNAGNINGILNGSGANVTSINANNISSGTLAQVRLANASLTVNGVSIALGSSGTVTATATNALTIGTGLGGTSYDGSSPVTITNSGVLSLANGGGITASTTTGAITLGSSATSANTAGAIVARGASGEFSAGVITATATNARYADLAECYSADADYEPGTVLVFGGDQEVTKAIGINDIRVAGVVSTNPAHVMNSGLDAKHTAVVALTGRVPTLVVGTVKKGDMMVTAGGGRAMACATPSMGSVIGKSLQDHLGGQGMIEIVVGRL
jgi:hypothetical protein